MMSSAWRSMLAVAAAAAAAVVALAAAAAPAHAGDTLVVFSAGNMVATVDSDAPGTLKTPFTPVAPLTANDAVVGADRRPADGKVYAVTKNSATGAGRLYTVNPATGAATVVGVASFGVLPAATGFGVDFNPVADRLRIVTDLDTSIRVNPGTGALAGTDTNLAYAPAPDPGAGTNPSLGGVAYDRSAAGATATTLFGFDSSGQRLVTIGGVNGSPSPNLGTLFTVAPMMPGTATGLPDSLDIGTEGTAYLVSNVFSGILFAGRLLRVNLASGSTTNLGDFAAGPGLLSAMTVQPSSRLQLTTKDYNVSETAGTVQVTLTRTGAAAGAATLQLATIDGSAEAGSDYTAPATPVPFAAGETSKVFSIPIANDAADEGDESFIVRLTGATGDPGSGASLGSPVDATVTIRNDDAPAPPAPTPLTPPKPTPPDTTAPGLAVTGVPSSVTRSQLLKGVKAKVTRSEPAALSATLEGTVPKATIAAFDLRLALASAPLGSGQAMLTLKPKSKFVGKPKKTAKVRLTVEGRDAAGNRRIVTKVIAVKPDKRKRKK